jgi:hypothetical protein
VRTNSGASLCSGELAANVICTALAARDKHKSNLNKDEQRSLRIANAAVFEMTSKLCLRSSLVAPINWLPAVCPMRAGIVGQIVNLRIGETRIAQL